MALSNSAAPDRAWAHAVVTGGAGFVGSHLCSALLAQGTAVTCVDDFCTGTPENVAHLMGRPGFSLRRGDVTEPFDGTGRSTSSFTSRPRPRPPTTCDCP